MKKKLFTAILAAAALLTLDACSSEPKSETRYILTEFQTVLFSGSVQKTVFHFDENWVQTGATVYMDGEVEQEMAFELDEQGTIKTITYTMGGETYVEEHVNTYDEDGLLIHQEVYQDGELTSTLDQTYDAEGNLAASVQSTAADYAGGSIITETTYNPDGTRASVKTTIPDMGTSLIEYLYDENGNEIRSVTTNENGIVTAETNTSYNNQGRMTVSVDTYYNDDGTPRETSAAEYIWEGNVRTTHVLGENGAEDSWSVVEFDDAGNMIRSEIYNGDTLMTSQSCTYVEVEIPAA